jgi:hypothetical protein
MMQVTRDGVICDTCPKNIRNNQYVMMVFLTNYDWIDNASDVYMWK